MLPRKNRGEIREYEPLQRPNRSVESALIGLAAVGINLVILILFTMIPWTERDGAPEPASVPVWIGQLPRQTLRDDADRQFDSFEVERSVRQRLAESIDSLTMVPLAAGQVTESVSIP